jgi:peptidoglycan/LPS O-acetylase OafA/YrhL
VGTGIQRGKRIEEIDALRGIAALFVLLFHYSKIYDFYHHLDNSLGFKFSIGYYGVYLFFVISGFVIVLTLHRCRTGLDFVVSRFSRIFPAYWAALIVSFIVLSFIKAPPHAGLGRFLMNFTMTERVFGLQHIDPVYWTLNVEMSFYLWMLLVFCCGLLDKMQRVIPAVLAVQLTLALYAHVTGHVYSQGVKVFLLIEYAHLFCAGMLFYQAWSDRFTWPRVLLMAWCLFNQTLVPFRDFDWVPPALWGDVAVGLIFLIMLLVVRGRLRWLVNPVLLFFGAVSYPLYLVHNEIGRGIMEDLALRGWSRWPGFFVAVSVSFAIAIAINWLVEKPAMKWIRQQYSAWKKRFHDPGVNERKPAEHVSSS